MLWKFITDISKKIEMKYKAMGYPLLFITRIIRDPMRWFYHLSPLFRHDSRFFLKPFLLKILHAMFVVTHPHDFKIYGKKIAFRSYGSFMSVSGYYVGEIEYQLVKYVISQLKPGFTFLDIGAHHGVFTVTTACELKKRGWKGVIHSFEPNPFNFSLLKHNVNINLLRKYVILHNSAVSDTIGKQTLYFLPEENSDCQLETVLQIDRENIQKYTTEVITLDTLLKKIKKVDLIKMDIQGAELLALRGGEKLINRDKPILVIEAVKNWPSTEKIKNFLIRHNYTLHGVDKKGKVCHIDSPDVFISWDLLALPTQKKKKY